MSLSPVNAGGWDPEEVLTSDQMNALQVELLKAIDGLNGGSYSLGSNLTFNGPGEVVFNTLLSILTDLVIEAAAFLQVEGTLLLSGTQTVTGDINVPSGGEINVQNLGRIDVESGGDVNLAGGADMTLAGTAGGADLDIADGARLGLAGTATLSGEIEVVSGGEVDIHNGGRIDVEGGGTVNLLSSAKILGSGGAEIQVFDADDLTINSSSGAFRLTLTPVQISDTGGVPDFKSHIPGIPTWLMHDATAAGGILFAVPLRPGDIITTLRMTLQGQAGVSGHSAAPATPPKLQLCSLTTAGVLTVIGTAIDGTTHPTYNSSHPVTLSGGLLPYTVGTDLLFARVITEGGAGAEADKTLLTAIDGTLIAKSFRGSNEVY